MPSLSASYWSFCARQCGLASRRRRMDKSFSTNQPSLETSQVAKAMGWRSRSRVSNLAKRDKWRFIPRPSGGRNPRRWYAEDVLLSARSVQRTALVRAIGKAYNKIYVRDAIKTDKYDIKCPVCQGFAIVLLHRGLIAARPQNTTNRSQREPVRGHV